MKLKYAQDLIKADTGIMVGFNIFVSGGGEPKRSDYGDKTQWYKELQGYEYAQKMAKENSLAFTHRFKCGKNNSCYPFEYGGFFVCNSCGEKSVDKEWWKIQVEKDGNTYCCHGLDFINLQESDNYAFGDTYEESITNYAKLFTHKNP
jgi:hypothetical protein